MEGLDESVVEIPLLGGGFLESGGKSPHFFWEKTLPGFVEYSQLSHILLILSRNYFSVSCGPSIAKQY